MACLTLPGEFLVEGRNTSSTTQLHVVPPPSRSPHPVLISNVSLSFWGGIDPLTGIVVDTSHPLCGICVSNCIVCLPSGRGSCTASQVLLELILNDKAPAAFVFRDVDGLACVGAIVAQEVFVKDTTTNFSNNNGTKEIIKVPDMIHIGTHAYQQLLQFQSTTNTTSAHGCVLPNGDFVLGESSAVVQDELQQWTNHHRSDTPPEPSFTDHEQALLDASTTEAQRMAYRVLFRYAHLGITTSQTPQYLDISQAHIDGCTYIGPGGLEFTQRLVKAHGRVQVPTTLNAVSADRRRHEQLGVPADYAAHSIALGNAYLALGCAPSFSCAPYLLSTQPKLGDQIAWGESNAVVYANSVIGARTEKYADYLDICCAITGKIPAAGVHLDQHRQPQIVLDATDMLQELMTALMDNSNNTSDQQVINLEMLFPTLGHVCGTLSDGKVPVLIGFESDQQWSSLITKDHLKAFCAAFGTTGTSPLVHMEGVTPETLQDPNLTMRAKETCPKKQVTWSQCHETFALLNNDTNNQVPATPQKIDLVALGNPHLSVQECHNLVSLIQAMSAVSSSSSSLSSSSSSSLPQQPLIKKHPHVRIMACLSREIHSQAQEHGYIDYLQEFGVEFINDTCWCMLLDPPVIPPAADAIILTNSGKYAHYGPGLTNRSFRYGSTADCIVAAVTGEYPVASGGSSVSNPPSTSSNAMTAKGIPSWLQMPLPKVQTRNFSTAVSTRGTWNNEHYLNPASRLVRTRHAGDPWTAWSRGRYGLQLVRKLLVKK